MRLACGVCSHACDKRRASPGGTRKKGAVVISTLYIRGRGGRRGHKNLFVGPRFLCSVFCPLAQEKMGSVGSSSARSREWVPGQCAAMDSCDHHTYHTKAEERLERRGQGDRDNRCTHSAPWLQPREGGCSLLSANTGTSETCATPCIWLSARTRTCIYVRPKG